MRLLLPALLFAALSACAGEVDEPVPDDIADPDPEFAHVCDALTWEAARAGESWTPDQVDACFEGCTEGEADGYDQGRLVCIVDGEFCPDCVADQEGEAFDAGYKACYAQSYRDGYGEEGCLEP